MKCVVTETTIYGLHAAMIRQLVLLFSVLLDPITINPKAYTPGRFAKESAPSNHEKKPLSLNG